ncbi:hypothetical protein [Streptomyces sp. NPDC056144]|uniref:hypothetical protein n=1 Tax=unclassified Streptomyces TaxID=2593676 RepID=UPI0035DAAF68
MRTNTLGLAAASAAVVLLALPTPAQGVPVAAPHKCEGGQSDSRGRSSVDGSEITWDDDTRFDDARKHAVKVWTAGTLNRVKIIPDGATTYADVEWRDIISTSGEWKDTYGKWEPHHGTDYLSLNRAYLDPGKSLGTDEDRRRVAAHELGHALGFCHKEYGYGTYPSLLWADYGHISGKKINGPTDSDVKAYHALWG